MQTLAFVWATPLETRISNSIGSLLRFYFWSDKFSSQCYITMSSIMQRSVVPRAVKMLLLVLLPLSSLAYDYDQQLTDPDLVGDIFGTQQEALPNNPQYDLPDQLSETDLAWNQGLCDAKRPCVECSVFHQYWKHYSSAFECYENCKGYSRVTQPVDDTVCRDVVDVCGIHGNLHVCEFKGNLDGDTICKAYQFVMEDNIPHSGVNTVNVFRPPCLADDLEVNKGIWNGETVVQGLDTYPNGWGILTYSEEDHLNRDKYDGNMLYGVMQGYGTLFWKDGSYYSGQFVNNSKAGEGTLFYSNGDIFTGQWVGEAKDGQGKYMFSKGGDYSGGFNSGAFDGDGEFNILHPNEDWEYFKGQYEGGYRKKGSYRFLEVPGHDWTWASSHHARPVYYPTGDLYEGDFSGHGGQGKSGDLTTGQGVYDGQGKYIWSCEKSYTGYFKNGQPDGEGVMNYPEGWTYEGQFKDGKFNGNGKFTWGPDNYYEGEFLGGEMTGNGLYYLASGGLYDSSVGLYYPQAGDKAEFYEAHFDGKTLRYKNPPVKTVVKKGGY